MTQAGGLDPKALAVYRAMLRFPDLSDDELADKAEVDRAEFGSLVNDLTRLGFVTVYASPGVDSGRYALTPESAIAQFASIQSALAVQVMSQVSAVAESLPGLINDHKVGVQRSENLLELEVVRRGSINQRLDELVSQTKRDVGFIVNVQPLDRSLPFNDSGEGAGPKLVARGGRVRLVVSATQARRPDEWVGVQRILADGQEVRLASGELPPMMAIFDMTAALVTFDLQDTREGAIVVRSPAIVIALRRLFEDYWRTCMPADAQTIGDSRQHEILRLLSSGTKDEAIARALGVGLRTIRREISDLMDQYGAGSRFQLGLLFERRAAGS